jgi:hypothetical protein
MQALRYTAAAIAFLLLFGFGFFVGGAFQMMYLAPKSAHPISVFEPKHWIDNWAGVLLGLDCGFHSARATLKQTS